MEFLISEEVQKRIPKKLWMMPVRTGTPLPDSFKNLPKPTRLVSVSTHLKKIESILKAWNALVKSR
jgi:ABC-type thiamine transport system substrate-binding protein